MDVELIVAIIIGVALVVGFWWAHFRRDIY
jgi:hypothetical protein